MKRYIKYLGFLFLLLIAVAAQSQVCCPKFTLGADFQPCDSSCHAPSPYGGAGGNPSVGGGIIVACKNQTHTYTVYPNLSPSFTYTWSVIGGTPTSFTGNPMVINWGNTNQGFIQVIITDAATGTCRDTIRRQVCLVDGPTASFTFAPNPVCLAPSLVQFTSTSVGASSFYWDFGDGSYSTLQNPTHAYAVANTYTVTLTVSTASGGGGVAQPERDCKCKDTAKATITVINKKGIDIHTDDCRMLCSGDTVKYCTSTTGCTGLNWVVNGGTIISGQGTTCIKVVWNQPSTWPTSVTLNATCPNTCGNTATIFAPVLYPNLPIQGPTPVCQGSTASYSLPVLPGTFYKWTLSGGGNIIGPDSNIAVININWTAVSGSYNIICNYHNPYSGCSGADTLTVTIRPPFRIIGPTPVCTSIPYNYFTNGAALTWTFTPPTGFTNTPVGSNQQTMNWSVPGNYSITATPQVPGNFCTPSATINIVVNPTPVLNPISGPNPVCPNQLSTYTVSSNVPSGLFTWTLTGGGTVSPYGPNNSNASVSFSGIGPWQLQASQTANGCTGTTTLNITKVGLPPPITLTPATVCSGGSVTASVTGIVPPGGYTWSATPGAVLTGAQGGTSTTFTVNSNATITVTSCGGSSTINVTTTPATVTITPTPGPCSVTLTASPGGGTYQWFLNGNPAGVGTSILTNQNGNWVVQATYPGGCQATAQFTVVGITPVNANITATGSLCNGGSVTITAGIPANCPTPVFTWSNAFVGNPLITNVAGNYFVTVTCANGCSAVSNTIPVVACNGGNGNGNCINDLIISPSNCANPVALTVTNTPVGCSSNTISWDYGDGYGNATGIHLYNNVGIYTVTAIMTCGNGTVHCGTKNITIPMVDSFTRVISCGINGWSVQLQDASMYLPSYAGYSILWSTSCGSLSATNIPNPVLTFTIGCNPTVTLTISKNGCTLVKSFTFNFPNTPFTINGPTPVCQGSSNSYSSSFTTGIISYNWIFGDIPPTTGVTNPISHVFTGTPPNPTISLSIKDQYGCIFTTSINVAVIVPRKLTIIPSPIIKICPDCAPPVLLTTSPLTGWTSYQWYHNGSAIGGANSSTYQLCNFDASGNYYVTANDTQNNNCPVTSDTVKVVYLPKPIADIQGQTIWCSGSTPGNISLANIINDPNCTYVWTATGPGTVTFSPDNLQFYANTMVSAYGMYQFILTVTDINTGCIAKDTACVFLYLAPTATINGPAGSLCEGTPYTFTCLALPPNPNYVYLWNNGVTGPTMTTAQAGGPIFCTVTNPVSGCSFTAYGPTIHNRPNVSLFPVGCDTMCAKDTLIPPLPLGPGQTYGSQYTIKWYVDGNYHSTGPFLILSGLALGPHQVYIVVTNIPWGCTSTSGIFNLFIDPCIECDCKGSKWGDIIMTQGNNPPVKLKCNNPYTLQCNLPYSINASFICKDTSCPGKVTYVLYPPSGSPITGNVPLNFTPVAGVYILTLYGWCGGKKCDSCTIDLTVKCDCDCKGSKWGPITVAQGDNGGGDVGKAVIVAPITVSCGKTYDLKCNQPYTVNASYICKDSACNGKVTYSLQPPTGLPITGTMPLTFTPNQNGVYILTLYGWCGNKICDSCVIKFNVTCDPCKCDGSHWGDIVLNGGDNGGNHDGDPKNVIANVVIGNPIALKCNNTYDLTCNKPYTVNATFICKDTNCNGKVTYSLKPPTGLPITGTLPLTFTPNQTGVYVLTLYGWCGNKICDSCVIKFNVKCDPCKCDGSHWGDIVLNGGDNGGDQGDPKNPVANIVIGNPGNPITLACKKSYTLNCKQTYTINGTYICKDTNCNGKVTYSLQPPTGLPITGNLALTFTPNQSGTYVLTLYGWCGNKICDSCVITFKVDCVDCDCKGSHWGEITATDNVKVTNLSCGKTYDWKCKVPFTINANYICAKPSCAGSVGYTFTPAIGSPTSGNLPFTYTPTQSGNYTIVLYGKCDNKICDTCKISFHVDCPVDTNCCKHDIKVETGNVTYTPNANSTIVGQTFTITGLSGVNLTEVRAEVVSYDLSSNFNNECLGCKTFPFTWASINSAGNIGAVPPKITLFGTTTSLFNPTGAAVYQNPREVIWNNGNAFQVTGPIGINFILPPTPLIDCCELSGKICVKFTFRDENCNECEVIVCFNVTIKKK